MGITIYSVNNSMAKEIRCAYDEKSLLNGVIRSVDNSPDGDPNYKLIICNEAVREIFDFIEWNKGKRNDLRNEQGGVLIGKRYYDEEKNIHFTVVSKAIAADNAIGSTGYLVITPECWETIYRRKDEYNESEGDNAIIVGWFHTHPNALPCFMSGTDRSTQESFFDGENTYSVVINPQRHLIKAFRSKECYAAQAFFVVESKKE